METREPFIRVFWNDMELMSGPGRYVEEYTFEFYVKEYGMPMEVDVKVYLFDPEGERTMN